MTRRLHLVTRLLTTCLLLSAATVTARSGRDAESQLSARGSTETHFELPVHDAPVDSSRIRREPGTRDAPVDGLDGKPHAGPFVEARDTVRKLSDDADGLSITETTGLGEDGVMNDRNRPPPKQGTTGTEGGVSEKDRDLRIKEFSSGERVAKVPDAPKSSLTDDGAATTRKSITKATGPGSDRETQDSGDKGFGGLKKPTDLPDKSYNTVVPESESTLKNFEESAQEKSSPEKMHKKYHDDDDDDDDHEDDDDDDEEDGKHDIIPWDSLLGSFSSIAATEIGDKTFIVAALMAMRHSKFQVFSAAFSALFIMTVLSGVAGHAMGAIISKKWSALVAALLFLVFGAKSLREGMEMSPDQGVSDEIREVEAELEEKEGEMARHAKGHRRVSSISPYALEAGRVNGRKSRSESRMQAQRSPSTSSSRSPSPSKATVKSAISGIKNLLSLLLSPAWVETFSMTFVGELGDRSQIATVAMAAGQEYYWVMVGASMGHFVCTAIAVVGGSVLAGRVSLRKVTLIGGGIFIFFGIFTLIEAAQYWT